MQRRLAAILAADVVDYSRLMGEDETGTIAELNELRKNLFEPLVAARGGNVIKRMGDGWIVEYPSVSDAVGSAIEVQEGLAEHQLIRLRIGVHIGDVTFQDDDIYGDGINVASRLEALAEPGQVLISDTAQHSLDGKAAERFNGGKTHQLKNIARPVVVWSWPADTNSVSADKSTEPIAVSFEPDKPSIAVLPFDNMSGDPEQEYFSDGIAEDIITDLSKFTWLTVIARNSSFSFKGQAVDLRTVAKELDVRYVLEGSVRKSGSRVRVTGQLIDASDGSHIWAERYDRELEDVFDLQDEMNASIVRAIAPQLENLALRRAQDKRPENLDAWDYVMRARASFGGMDKKAVSGIQDLANKALELEPGYPDALAYLAMTHATGAFMGWTDQPIESIARAIETANKALQRDQNNVQALVAKGFSEAMAAKHDEAINTLRLAVQINPNDATAHGVLASSLYFSGNYAEALKMAELAVRISPRGNEVSHVFHSLGYINLALGKLPEAKNWLLKAIQQNTNLTMAYRNCAVVCVELGEQVEAEEKMAKFLKFEPRTTVKLTRERSPLKDSALLERIAQAAKAAGMPEG